MTENHNDLICHCEGGTSDKVYIASIRETTDGRWQLTGQWGKRGRNLNCQKKGTFSTKVVAHSEQRDLLSTKTRKDYVDIRSSRYTGSLTVNSAWLQNYLEEDIIENIPPERPVPVPATISEGNMFEVICTDNIGVEDGFDQDIEYLAQRHADGEMLWVHDKFGVNREMFTERFQVVAFTPQGA